MGGFAKGSGMIQPDMATMLSVLSTDAPLTPKAARVGNISEILADLKKRKIKRGHLTIGKDNYCVFSPKII